MFDDEVLIPLIELATFKGKVFELNENYCPFINTFTVCPEFLKASVYNNTKEAVYDWVFARVCWNYRIPP